MIVHLEERVYLVSLNMVLEKSVFNEFQKGAKPFVFEKSF
jgi:hypothetical protein